MDERKSTISKSILPVGQSTRESWAQIQALKVPWEGWWMDEVMYILAEADARDPFAVANLLYAWRTGQLA
jgi:hypothetical protein